MRRRTTFLLIAITALAAVVILTPHRNSAPNPTVNGKPLSYWLSPDYERETHLSTDLDNPVDESIKAAGTNALPFLLEQIQRYRRHKWKFKAVALSEAILPGEVLPDAERYLLRNEMIIDACVNAFSVLGTNANPAIHDLTSLATNSEAADRRQLALAALGQIGTETIPIFWGIISNESLPHRAEAIHTLIRMPDAQNTRIITVLCSRLEDSDPNIRQVASNGLQRIAPQVLTNYWLTH